MHVSTIAWKSRVKADKSVWWIAMQPQVNLEILVSRHGEGVLDRIEIWSVEPHTLIGTAKNQRSAKQYARKIYMGRYK